MTKKDYKKFADMMVELLRIHGRTDALDDVEHNLKLIFMIDNERFNEAKWKEYIKERMALT